ncbi:MAG TPA: polyprenyl diphosphate synthase [Gammaproteobacteria bacterium]|jgi:undecaprenyl diphosphate synthase
MNGNPQINIVPNHVAIIMDGNGRWAELRNQPRNKGHRQGVKSVKHIVKACIKRKISTLTLFAFSSENWKRPHNEVSLLMDLFLSALGSELKELDGNGVRLRFIGDRSDIPANVQRAMENAETQTADNEVLSLVVAIGYGGQWDIRNACQSLAQRVEAGEIKASEITEQDISDHLSTVDLPPPDLFIRTGGEHRISNFLLWQLAYTEMYFTDVLWPDFNELAFDMALDDYAKRQRRYGMTPEQINIQRSSHA